MQPKTNKQKGIESERERTPSRLHSLSSPSKTYLPGSRLPLILFSIRASSRASKAASKMSRCKLLRVSDCDPHPLPPATAAFFFSLIEIYIYIYIWLTMCAFQVYNLVIQYFIYYVSWNDHNTSSSHLLASEQYSLVNWAASRSHLEKEFHCQKERKVKVWKPSTRDSIKEESKAIKNLSMGLVRSISSDSDALTSWGLADPGETVPPRTSQFAQVVKGSPVSTPFTCKPVNSEPIPQAFSSSPYKALSD